MHLYYSVLSVSFFTSLHKTSPSLHHWIHSPVFLGPSRLSSTLCRPYIIFPSSVCVYVRRVPLVRLIVRPYHSSYIKFHVDALYNMNVYMCTTLLGATTCLRHQSVHVTPRVLIFPDVKPRRQVWDEKRFAFIYNQCPCNTSCVASM